MWCVRGNLWFPAFLLLGRRAIPGGCGASAGHAERHRVLEGLSIPFRQTICEQSLYEIGSYPGHPIHAKQRPGCVIRQPGAFRGDPFLFIEPVSTFFLLIHWWCPGKYYRLACYTLQLCLTPRFTRSTTPPRGFSLCSTSSQAEKNTRHLRGQRNPRRENTCTCEKRI